MRSLSFPAIGTGNLRFPRDMVSIVLLREIHSFSRRRTPRHLREVVIVVHPSDSQTEEVSADSICCWWCRRQALTRKKKETYDTSGSLHFLTLFKTVHDESDSVVEEWCKICGGCVKNHILCVCISVSPGSSAVSLLRETSKTRRKNFSRQLGNLSANHNRPQVRTSNSFHLNL